MDIDKPGRKIAWVKLLFHVGIEDVTQADLLAIAGRLADPPYPSQHGVPRCDQRGKPPPKKRKVALESLSPRSDVLSARDAATILQSLGLEVMSECPFGLNQVWHNSNDNMVHK